MVFAISSAPTGDRAPEIHCKRIEAKDTLTLRQSVLWPDKNLAFVQLLEDDTGIHLGAFLMTEAPVAIISLFTENIPHDTEIPPGLHMGRTVRFRKFACDTKYQHKGIGSQLLEYAVSFARSHMSGALLWCDARTTTLVWYQKRGFKEFGERFYKGPVEYVRVRREL